MRSLLSLDKRRVKIEIEYLTDHICFRRYTDQQPECYLEFVVVV